VNSPNPCVQGAVNPLPLYRLADLHRQLGDVPAWRRTVQSAFECAHVTAEQLYARGKARLILGDWSGWLDYEARRLEPSTQSRCAPLLQWSSRAWTGIDDRECATLLVYLERGFGDSIQMLRFLPALADPARRVLVAVRPSLITFVQCNLGASVPVIPREPCPTTGFDRFVFSMSLPAMSSSLPTFVPSRTVRRRLPLAGRPGRAVAGVCWAGNPRHLDNASRSMPLAALAPVLERGDIAWFSLQVGDRAADASAYSYLAQPEPSLTDFADTGDFLLHLDCVVTVDTAVAHLAGSLGVPTFLLIAAAGDWRWGLLDRTPWYPSIRIIRQVRQGDWQSVVQQLAPQLDAWLQRG
jgi:hypothetical protein